MSNANASPESELVVEPDANELMEFAPHAAEQIASYELLLDQLCSVIADAATVGIWTTMIPSQWGPCSNDEGGGITGVRGLSTTRTTTPIPTAQWPAALDALRTAADPHGFVLTEIVVDRQDDHLAILRGPDEAVLTFATSAVTRVEIVSGCLPVDAS